MVDSHSVTSPSGDQALTNESLGAFYTQDMAALEVITEIKVCPGLLSLSLVCRQALQIVMSQCVPMSSTSLNEDLREDWVRATL